MKIEQLHYLVEIANTGSISTAAERLHVSQPNISQSIQALEQELNTRLFKRSRIGTQPTENGLLIIEKARSILKQINDLKNLSETPDSSLSGTLTISAIPSMCLGILPKALGVFKNKYPKVQIEIAEVGSLNIKEQVLKDKVDLGLVSRRKPEDFDERFLFETLFAGEVMAFVSKKSKFSSKKNITIKEIINFPIVIFNQEYRINPYIINLLKKYGEPNILFTSSNLESLKKVVVEDLAIGFYADIALKVDPYVHNGDIVPLHISDEKTNTLFGVLNKESTPLSTIAVEFIKELKVQATTFKRLYNLNDTMY